MKKLFVLLMALFTLAQVDAQEKNVIRIATDNTDLILQVAPNGRLDVYKRQELFYLLISLNKMGTL